MSKHSVLIVGKGSPDVAAWRTTDEWEIWGCNDMTNEERQITYTRWFELHRYEHLEREWRGRLATRLGEWFYREIPVYTFHPEEFPTGPWTLQPFPYDAMANELPRGEYHCSSMDWMVAYAIFEGFTTIHVTGVNMWSTHEPPSARACLEYWVGVAEGMGLDITIDGFDTFKMFHTVRSVKPYGLDPSWVPIEDVDAPGSVSGRR